MLRFRNSFLLSGLRAVSVVRLATVLVILAVIVTAAKPTRAETAPNAVRIAYTDFPPVQYRNEKGEPAGLFVELTQKVVEEAGYKAEFIFLPVSRIFLYLKNGNVDFWPGLSGVTSLEGTVLESWVNVFPVQLSAWYRDTTEPLTHLDQLNNTSVIVIGGYSYGGLLEWLKASKRIRLTEAPNHRAAIDMLKLNRGDYVLDYRQPVQNILSQPSDSLIRESEIRTRNSAWLFSLASPRAALLRDELDDAYLRMVNRGDAPPMQNISSKAFIPGFPEEHR